MGRLEKAILLLSIIFTLLLLRTIYTQISIDTRQPSIDDAELPEGPKATDIKQVVALYSDRGTWNESVIALKNMFQWANHTVQLIDARYINERVFDDFSIMCFPGGDMYQYSQDITSTGKEKIRNFILDGGGYLGICGGAYFASDKVVWRGTELPMKPLRLFQGTAKGPSNDIIHYPDYTMCKVNIVNTTHQITKGYSDAEWMLYYWGPVLLLEKDADVIILGNYDKIDQPAIIAFDYGYGKAFLIGTHPEIDENTLRDGTNWGEELDDNGSDWTLLDRAVKWLENR